MLVGQTNAAENIIRHQQPEDNKLYVSAPGSYYSANASWPDFLHQPKLRPAHTPPIIRANKTSNAGCKASQFVVAQLSGAGEVSVVVDVHRVLTKGSRQQSSTAV